MGMLTKLFGGADGCREAMRESYHKHVQIAREGRIPTTDPPHTVGLYGSLGSRYRARGTPIVEAVMWGELAPFLAMREVEAVEALAEYIVYQERPRDARVPWLKNLVNSSLLSCKDSSRVAMAAVGFINQVAWCSLLEPKTMKMIERAVEKLEDMDI